MAMPAPPAPITTIEQLLAVPEDGLRHELLDGVHVVTPAPSLPHQAVLGAVSYALERALEGHAELMLLASPADIVISPRTLVQPDLFVIRKPANIRLVRWSDVGVPCWRSSSCRPAPPRATGAPNDGSISRRASPSTGSWTWTRGSWSGGGPETSGRRS